MKICFKVPTVTLCLAILRLRTIRPVVVYDSHSVATLSANCAEPHRQVSQGDCSYSIEQSSILQLNPLKVRTPLVTFVIKILKIFDDDFDVSWAVDGPPEQSNSTVRRRRKHLESVRNDIDEGNEADPY